MAYNRPSIDEIFERIKSDVKLYTGIKSFLRRSFVYAFAKAMSGIAHLLFGFIEWAFEQLFPWSQDEEYLLPWASMFDLEPAQATYTELTAAFTGTPNTVIAEDRIFKSDLDIEYQSLAVATIDENGDVSIPMICLTAGTSGNLSAGDRITISQTLAGLNSEGEVSSIDVTARDKQSTEDFRALVMEKMAAQESGGNANDYILKAKEVAGVTRAWVFPEALGRGSVVVKFVCDDEEDIIPDAAKVQEVLSYLNTWKPVTARLEVNAPVAKPLNMTIALDPNTAEVQSSVEAEINDLILRTSQVRGAYKNEEETYDGKILLSKIREAISIANGESDHSIVSMFGVDPDNAVPADFEIITSGVITWQAL